MSFSNLPPISSEDISYFREHLIKKLVVIPDGNMSISEGIDKITDGMDTNLKKIIDAGAYMITQAFRDGEDESAIYWYSTVAQLSTLLLLDRVLEAEKLAKIYNM